RSLDDRARALRSDGPHAASRTGHSMIAPDQPTTDAVIEVEGVSKWFKDVVAVSDITCSIGWGVTALLGPNGAGKSTLFRLLCGLTTPSHGTVRVLGSDARRDVGLARHIG